MTAEGSLACRSADCMTQLRFGCDDMRRTLPAQRHYALAACGFSRLAVATHPTSLHIAVRKGIARFARNVHFVCRKLQCAVFNARIHGQMQPLALALIVGAACCSMHRRLRRRAGLGRRRLRQHHMALDHGRLELCIAALPALCCRWSSLEMRREPVAAGGLPGSRLGGLLNACVPHPVHAGQHRTRPQLTRHFVTRETRWNNRSLAALALACNHHAAGPVHRAQLDLPLLGIAELHISNRRAPVTAQT